MNRWIRAWGATALAWALVLVIGGVAIAGAGSTASHSKKPTPAVSSSDTPDPSESESPEPSDSGTPKAESTAAADNHGACVSHWVHEAKDQGLSGHWFGHFVSGVAQSGDMGATCDESAALAKALQDQGNAPTTHGHGNAPDSKTSGS